MNPDGTSVYITKDDFDGVQVISCKQIFKDTLSGLRQFLAVERPLKVKKYTFYFTLSSFRSQDIENLV